MNYTRVLGVYVDSDLTFNYHSQYVHSRLLYRWSSILKYGNKHCWGIDQRVMVHLIKVLFLPTLFYGGMIWMDRKNVSNINKLWYTVLKTSLGATFNVKLELCEIILGLPPIDISDEIQGVKHFLKLNLISTDDDPLRFLIWELSTFGNCSALQAHLLNSFKFLKWKLSHHSDEVNAKDCQIFFTTSLCSFIEFSSKCCSYTKNIIKLYTEYVWQIRINKQWFLKGCAFSPSVSGDSECFNSFLNREIECLTLSLLYTNNLLNSFLFHHFPTICSSPMCGCGEAEQTVFHIVLECKGTSIGNASETIDKLKDVLCRNINHLSYKDLLSDDFSSVLIDYSRDANVMSSLSQRV